MSKVFSVYGLRGDLEAAKGIFRAAIRMFDSGEMPEDSTFVLTGDCLPCFGKKAKVVIDLCGQYGRGEIEMKDFRTRLGFLPTENKDMLIEKLSGVAKSTNDAKLILTWLTYTSGEMRKFLGEDFFEFDDEFMNALYAFAEVARTAKVNVAVVRGDLEKWTVADVGSSGMKALEFEPNEAVEILRDGLENGLYAEPERYRYRNEKFEQVSGFNGINFSNRGYMTSSGVLLLGSERFSLDNRYALVISRANSGFIEEIA